VQEWRAQQVPLNRGASARELRVLEDLLGMRLPDDLAALYSLANGMQDYAHDQHHVSFWSIQRMVADRNDNGPDEIGFADFLIGSWYFVYKPNPPAAVTVCWQSDPGESLPSVSAFLEAYASTPERFCVL
jgi:hypothetical protein